MGGRHCIEIIDGSYLPIELKHGGREATVRSMIRLATRADAQAIAAIYRPIVAATAISFETLPPDPAEIERRLAAILEIAPWLVHQRRDGVAGYAYGSRHRVHRAPCARRSASPPGPPPWLLRLRRDPEIRAGRLPALRELLLRVLVVHRAGDDDVLALLPVGRRRHLVLGGELDRVDDPKT